MEGEWAGGPSPPPCGLLMRCFSAVAELLVNLCGPDPSTFQTDTRTHVNALQSYEHVYSQEAEYIKVLKVTIKYNTNTNSNNTIHVKIKPKH